MSDQHGPEYYKVELPCIQQLQQVGWEYLEGDQYVPYVTERESFKDVLLKGRLREALVRLNPGEDGQPWLDEARVDQAVARLKNLGRRSGLLETNKIATELLIKGTQVEGPDGKNVTISYVDFEHPERNGFLAVNQFRVDPPWATGDRGYIVPDLVMFANGIPLVVIEAKRPDLDNPLFEAIKQLLRYSNQREGVDEPEGAEALFHYAQLMVATCFDTARLGTVGAQYRHYLEWKDTHPLPLEQVAGDLGVAVGELAGQQTLVEGALRPERLLDIVRCFTLFAESGGREVKIVPRYQQYRAVHKAVERLRKGKTRLQDGEHDRRGGIVWHTQGSGKSYTMVFLVRVMRTLPGLRRFKIVVVTDRTKLEKQLADTAVLTGEPLERARKVKELQTLLRAEGAGLVFGMIQKVQERGAGELGLLNDSEEILLLVDEAHRSHTKTLHANLIQALPNCAKIGFTGTPIMEADKKPTHEIFGPYIDTYTIRTSQQDGSTVRILYEGRKMAGDVIQQARLDARFQETFWEYTPEEREAIKSKYATTGDVLEAEQLIAAKARDMLRHYVTTVLPEGFKAQVAAVSRLAAVRYQKALVEARRELVDELETLAQADQAAREASPLAEALPYLERIRRLKFAAVISALHNDKPIYKPWTQKGKQGQQVKDFKKAFNPEKGEGYTAILIIKDMLLTGFDAPLEQVLYMDRPMRGYALLQAIARVNRTYDKKDAGLVVDYYGLAQEIQAALEIYGDDDRAGAFRPITDELPRLQARHRRVVALFESRRCDLDDTDACVNLLRDERLRAQFTVLLRDFLQTLDTILPRPEALPYDADARQLGLIRALAANRYRDQHLNIAGAEAKVRALIDEHVVGQGIDPTLPPIDILDAGFEQHVGRIRSPRAQAAEMEFAIRHHVRRHYQEDPVYYRRLSERLEAILAAFEDHWEAQVQAFRDLLHKHLATQEQVGHEERVMQPFLRLLVDAAPTEQVGREKRDLLAQATIKLVGDIRAQVRRVHFWFNRVAQEELRGQIAIYLDDEDLVPYDQVEALADQIVQTARANHQQLSETER